MSYEILKVEDCYTREPLANWTKFIAMGTQMKEPKQDDFMGLIKISNLTKTLTCQNVFIVATNRLGVVSDKSVAIVKLSIVKPPIFAPFFSGDLPKFLEINLESALPEQTWVI